MRRKLSNILPTRRRGHVQREGVVAISPNEPCPCESGKKYKRCCRDGKGLKGWWRRRQALKRKAEQMREEASNSTDS